MTPPRILVTGFEPFGGDAINPSWSVARALHRRRIAGHLIQAVELPCAFGASLDMLDAALQRWQPALVLALGLAAGRAELSLERIAINVDDARIPDNAGHQPVDRPIVRRGPAAHFSTLPIKTMAAAILAAGIPAGISQTAGTFVCNHVFYGLQHRLRRMAVRSGFMHVPLQAEQSEIHPGLPWLPLDLMIAGTSIALAAALRHCGDDLPMAAGTIA
jgi:pyroglutamyl-peptidase